MGSCLSVAIRTRTAAGLCGAVLLAASSSCSEGSNVSGAGGNPSGVSSVGGSWNSGGRASSGSGGALTGGALSNGGTPSNGGKSGIGGEVRTGGGGRGGTGAGGTGGASSGGADGGIGGATSGPLLENMSRLTVGQDGLTIVSYGGYLNGESFQQDGITSYGDYQYVAYWNKARHVVLVRRGLGDSVFTAIEFTDYTNREDDAHNTISIGICPEDGSLHLAFDHHNSPLHYRKSVPGLLTNEVPFAAASFEKTRDSLTAGSAIASLTYPRFVTSPSGKTLLMSARLGESGSGDEHLWEYSGENGEWVTLGKYIDGQSGNENPYPHGLAFGPDDRLNIAWCTRSTPDATTNHDLYFMWSPDRGRTWKDDGGIKIGETGKTAVKTSAAAVRVWQIAENRGLINQEHMVVDSSGGIHVLLSHMPDAQASDTDFTRARTKSEYFHYYRAPEGEWVRHVLQAPALENFRGKLAVAPSGNVYAVLPNLRIVAADRASNYASWQVMSATPTLDFFSDPLVDPNQIAHGRLTIFAPLKNSAELELLDFDMR